MKLNDFKIMLRGELKEIISTEVRRAIAWEFKLIRENLDNNNPASLSSILLESDDDSTKGQSNEKPVLFRESANIFANILNQTITEPKNSTNDQQLVKMRNGMRTEYASMIDGDLTSNNVIIPKTSASGKPVNPETLPDFLVNAMNKDYRPTLKAIKKMVKSTRPM